MTESNKKILIIEDEPEIRRFLRISLSEQGYVVISATDGSEGLELASQEKPELIILDLGLPDRDGLDVLRSIRDWSQAPIIIVSARGNEESKVSALDMGADDYLTKPFGVQELLARIRVAMRKNSGGSTGSAVVTVGKLKVDMAKRLVFLDDIQVHLTPIEYGLLQELVKNVGGIVTQQTLLRSVWGLANTQKSHYLRVYMSSLRQKLEENPAQPRYIITESGVGYRLKDD
jgi:two-component system, OmpR family, KDP operon response regulator KdpE